MSMTGGSYREQLGSLFSGMRDYLSWSTILLASGFLLGTATAVAQPTVTDFVLTELSVFAEGVIELSPYQLVVFIFFNNTVKALAAALLGVLFGIVPVIFLVVNGFVLGIVVAVTVLSNGWLTAVAGILPHGIFELPALLFATSSGMMLGVHFTRQIRGTTNRSFLTELFKTGRFFVMVIIPLFFVAALVEAFLTVSIVESL